MEQEPTEPMRPMRKLEDMPEIQEMLQVHPNMQIFEYRWSPVTEEWTSEPPLPPAPVAREGQEAWPPRHKILERIVVLWLDPTAEDTDPHEFWLLGGLNLMPYEGYLYYVGRYVVSKEQKTMTCIQEIGLLDGGWFEDHTMTVDYLRRCLPWLADYTLVQTCRAHRAWWTGGEALLAAFTEGEVLETTERRYMDEDD